MKNQNIPSWLLNRYLTLKDKFGDNTFDFEEAADLLQEKYQAEKNQVKVTLSELSKLNLLEVSKKKKDKRERTYKLLSLAEYIETNKLARTELTRILKQAADIIRTRVDYTFILLLLFYKRISDKWQREFEKKKKELIKAGWSKKDAEKEALHPTNYDFQVPPQYTWSKLRKDPLRLSENLSAAMKALAENNPAYQDIFIHFDFLSFTKNPESNEILRQLFELFSQFSFDTVSPDILGDAYEWILKYFAPSKAKEGEVYTPREVIKLMIELLDPKENETIYDPAAGSAGMLIAAYKHVEEKKGKRKADTLLLRGQEQNEKTLALSKMNILLHGIRNATLLQGDTLLRPKFKEGDDLQKFDKVIANPPWNQKGYDEARLKRGELWQKRYKYGFTTKQSADWAWIQHMLFSTKPNGKLAVVLDTGAFSRGGRERAIVQKIVENDLLEAIILLPEKLFYNTSAPGLIAVFNKQKPVDRKDKVLVINASGEFEAGKPQNRLSDKNIKTILKAYRKFATIEDFSKVVDVEDINKVNWNLSPSRYVLRLEKKEHRPIKEILEDIEQLENKIEKNSQSLKKLLSQLQL